MKAYLPSSRVSNAKNLSPKKETIGTIHVICGTTPPKLLAEAQFYMGRSSHASVVYCSVWVFGWSVSVSGHGKAGGYGYCKKSAALADALASAGITLSEDISGCGESAIREAMLAVAEACGYAPEDSLVLGV